MDNEAVFLCVKCRHHLFLNGEEIMPILKRLDKYNCPNCGEEGCENWMFSHVGDSNKEINEYKWK